jgi:Holliday junction resolvase RusA-like endonuclease
VTANDRIFFRIPRDKLYPSGLKRLLRIEKYNDYKISVSAEAKRQNFTLPPIGAGVIFYLPVPKSWSNKKKKLAHGKFHSSRPDLKNLLSAWEDSLLSEDKEIAYYTHLGKRWVNSEEGFIEITITDPTCIYLEPPPVGGVNSLL